MNPEVTLELLDIPGLRTIGGYKVEHPYEVGKVPFLDLINRSKGLIQIVEDLDHLNTHTELTSALTRAADRGINIEMISGPSQQRGYSDELWDLLEIPNVNLYENRVRPRGHFVLVDGKHVGVETYHEPGELPTAAYTKYHTIATTINRFLGMSRLSIKMNAEFEELKNERIQNH